MKISCQCSFLTYNNIPYNWECPSDMKCGYNIYECCMIKAEPGNGEIITINECHQVYPSEDN